MERTVHSTSISWKVNRLNREDVTLYKLLEEFTLQKVERLLSELLDENENVTTLS